MKLFYSNITLQWDYTAFLLPIILLMEGRPSYLLAWLTSAVIHEIGHLCAAKWLHIPIQTLHISILGAQLRLTDPLLSYRKEWLLCATGPLFSTLGALCAIGLGKIFPYMMIWNDVCGISMALGLINLLPIGWLDGGRMHRAFCYQFFTPTTARAVVRLVSFLCFLLLWMTSVYLMLHFGNSLSLFAFSFTLFLRFFLSDAD